MLKKTSLQGFLDSLEEKFKKPVKLKGVKLPGNNYIVDKEELKKLLKRNGHNGSSKQL